MRAAQHRTERNVQITQAALKGSAVQAVMLRRMLLVSVPCRVRERALLGKQQQKNTNELQKSALHVRQGIAAARVYCATTTASVRR